MNSISKYLSISFYICIPVGCITPLALSFLLIGHFFNLIYNPPKNHPPLSYTRTNKRIKFKSVPQTHTSPHILIHKYSKYNITSVKSLWEVLSQFICFIFTVTWSRRIYSFVYIRTWFDRERDAPIDIWKDANIFLTKKNK